MLPSLRDTQAAFAALLVGHDDDGPMSAIGGDARIARQRLQLHRRHGLRSLGAALAATFSTVAAVVGHDFFDALAHDFVDATPLEDPILSRYGEHFDRFIAAKHERHGLPYLADVARLDWALNVAFHAPLEPRLSAADLTVRQQEFLPSLSIRLPTGSSLIESAYPLDLIWQVSQPGASVGEVDLAAGPVRLVVFRRSEDAAFAVLTPGEATFIERLHRGDRLATAARHASRVEEEFDLAATFAQMLGLGLLAAGRPT